MRMFSGVGSKACSIRCSVAVFRKHGCEVAMLIGMQGSCRGQLKGASRRDCRSSEYACGCFLVWGETCAPKRGEKNKNEIKNLAQRLTAALHSRCGTRGLKPLFAGLSFVQKVRLLSDGAHAHHAYAQPGTYSEGVLDC